MFEAIFDEFDNSTTGHGIKGIKKIDIKGYEDF